MTPHGNSERRIERNSADIDAICNILVGHDHQFAQITAVLADHGRRLDGIDSRLDGHDARFDKVDASLAEILRRLPEPPAA